MINAGIIGATGYAGEELIDLLLKHPYARISSVCAKIDKAQAISEIFPKFSARLNLICKEPDIKEIAGICDLVFLALPHTVSMELAPKLLKAGRRVIDLSADYRLKDRGVYEKFYKVKHIDKANLASAVYGLPELYRNKIKDARLIANPGCYPTGSLLGLAPLLAFGLIDTGSIIIDAKSGVTGAGRKLSEGLLFSEVNEDFKAYKINEHQHAPEINQELSKLAGKKVSVTFVPHLLPLSRGILSTIYVNKTHNSQLIPRLRSGQATQNLLGLYRKFYKDEPFVRIRREGDFPRLKDVVKTNFCDIGIKEGAKSAIIVTAIDNLLKGASAQAVQNMNIMYKFPEETALL